jgi:hypothetical protein
VPVPEGYSQMRQIVLNALLQRRENVIAFLLTILVLVPFYVAYKMTRADKALSPSRR